MRTDPESFRGKLYLLVIDKLVIGAVIALALVMYDWWRTEDLRHHERQARDVQLRFEQAKLIKEFLPVIVDPKNDVVTRAYVLRSAIATGSLDAEAGIELGRSLLAAGLDDHHFRRVMASTMPTGLPALARLAEQMSVRFPEISPRKSAVMFSSESDPSRISRPLREATLLRSVILETVPGFEGSYEPLESASGLSSLLYGLFVLLQPGSSSEAIDLSHSRSRGISLIGNLGRVFFDSVAIAKEWLPEKQMVPVDVIAKHSEAALRIERELHIDSTSLDEIRYARVIIRILFDYGPPAGRLAVPLARLVVAPKLSKILPQSVLLEYRSLRWDAGELLLAMQRNPKNAEGFNGAQEAEPILLAFVQNFREHLSQASTQEQLKNLDMEYEGGKLPRRVIEILGGFDSAVAKTELKQLRDIDSDKLRYFPFLAEDIEHAMRPH